MVKMLFHSLEVRSHPLPLTPPPMIEGATTPDHDFMRCVVQLGHKTSCCNAVSLTLPNAFDLKPINIYIYIYIYSSLCLCLMKFELIKREHLVLCSRGKKCYSNIYIYIYVCVISLVSLLQYIYMLMLFVENYCILLQ